VRAPVKHRAGAIADAAPVEAMKHMSAPATNGAAVQRAARMRLMVRRIQ
jgi:hypothetical protein